MKERLTTTAAMLVAALGMIPAIRADAGTLVWNGADGDAWNSSGWLSGGSPATWADGADAQFPAAATVALNGQNTVSNLTTAAALTLSGAATVSQSGFIPKSAPVLAFPGRSLADIVPFSAQLGGKSIRSGNELLPATAFNYKVSGGAATAQFQARNGIYLLCVVVEFTDGDDGVFAKAVRAGYIENGTPGADFDTVAYNAMSIATSMDTYSYGVCDIGAVVLNDSRIRIAGEASLGGALSLSNATAEVTAPISQTWSQPVTGAGGRLCARGLSSESDEKTYGITDPGVGGADAAWLTDTSDGTVFTNMVLARMEPVSAVMRGTHIGSDSTALPYRTTFDGQTMTCQFQFAGSSGWIKGAIVEFKQVGANVSARWVQAYYLNPGQLGDDVTRGDRYGRTLYGVKSLTLRAPDVPSLALPGTASCGQLVADNAQLVLAATAARPGVSLVARNGAQVQFSGGEGAGTAAGAGRTYRFESGSTMLALANMTTDDSAQFVFDASTLYLPMRHPSTVDGRNYVNHMTLRNGARVVGNPLRCGSSTGIARTMTYASEGASGSEIASGIDLVNDTNSRITNTLVLATSAPLEISGPIYDYPFAGYDGVLVVKRGDSTLLLSGANTFAGRLTVEAGTLALGGDDALPASAPVTLAGGTVSCGSSANTAGSLTLAGDATIALESGTLAFADSSGATWAAVATLAVTGPSETPAKALRFGTTSDGLTKAQLQRIRYNGKRVALDVDGYLVTDDVFVIVVR